MQILSNIEIINIEKKTAVDFGTGPWGFAAIFPLLKKAKYCIGFDVSITALTTAQTKLDVEMRDKTFFATSDGEIIPIADNTVDIFFAGESIEHVRNPFLFIQEILRVCKEDALIIISTPSKDALLYKLNNIQYCVGTEHISLLSYYELQILLDLFTDEIKIIGYETSIGPGLDSLYLSPDTCTLLQNRSSDYPELSSGLISISKANKQKYQKIKKNLDLNETLWDFKFDSLQKIP